MDTEKNRKMEQGSKVWSTGAASNCAVHKQNFPEAVSSPCQGHLHVFFQWFLSVLHLHIAQHTPAQSRSIRCKKVSSHICSLQSGPLTLHRDQLLTEKTDKLVHVKLPFPTAQHSSYTQFPASCTRFKH